VERRGMRGSRSGRRRRRRKNREKERNRRRQDITKLSFFMSSAFQKDRMLKIIRSIKMNS
jgi:hypothetical protein